MLKSGIYKILNKITGKFYIGSAINFTNRFYKHKWYLNNNKHPNIHLQRAWNLYGKSSFEFIIIEYIPVKMLLDREQLWLNWTNDKISYNICKIAGTKLGVSHSEKTKNKISKANKGHKRGMTGRKHSKLTRELQSIAQKGLTNRDFKKWPHDDGYYCKCGECKRKRNDILNKARKIRVDAIKFRRLPNLQQINRTSSLPTSCLH